MEQIVFSVAGILRNLDEREEADASQGKINLENSMIITNERVILLTIPVKSKILGEKPTDKQIDLIREEIETKLENLISNFPLEEILKQVPNFSINLGNIKKVEIHDVLKRTIIIKTKTGQTYSYNIWSGNTLGGLRHLFNNYL